MNSLTRNTAEEKSHGHDNKQCVRGHVCSSEGILKIIYAIGYPH